jgi:hypothetical protein
MMPPDHDNFASDRSITTRVGFLAMIKFLEAFYARAGDDFATLLTDIQIQPDGGPLDPAAWSDWIDAVARAENDT